MSSSTTTSSPFTNAVVGAMRKLYPEKLADSSFDNTGLLLEAPHRPSDEKLKPSVLLTIDLTKAVADEAIARRDSVVISYHPIIFRGLKAFTLANTQQTSLLRLAQEGISVYSPHTAVDAAPGGLNDWLADIVTEFPEGFVSDSDSPPLIPIVHTCAHTRQIIKPITNAQDLSSLPPHFSSSGYGRIVTFSTPQTLGSIISRITFGLGHLNGVSVAVPQSTPSGQKSQISVKTVGICAGSGGSMLNGLDVDLLFTGELSHHEALAAVEKGQCVITAFHSNTERAFLKQRMKRDLTGAVLTEMGNMEILTDDMFEIAVSQADKDPFEIVTDPGERW